MEHLIADNEEVKDDETSASNKGGTVIFVSSSGRGTHNIHKKYLNQSINATEHTDSSTSRNEEVDDSVTYRGGVRYKPDSQTTNLAETCDPKKNACARIKHKTSVRKQYKQWIKKLSSKYKTENEKKHEGKSEIYVEEDPHKTEEQCSNFFLHRNHLSLKISQPTPQTNCKEHVIDEEDTDVDHDNINRPQAIGQVSNVGDFTDLWNGNQEISNESRSGSVCPCIPSNNLNGISSINMDSILAPFLSSDTTFNTQERYFYAEDEEDIRLLQILRYVKHSAGGIDLLYNFIENHICLGNGQENANHEDEQNSSSGEYSESEVRQCDGRNSEEEYDATDEERFTDEEETQQLNFRYELSYATKNLTDHDIDGDDYDEKSEDNKTENQEEITEGQSSPLDDSKTESDSDVKSFQQYHYENRLEELEGDPNEENCNYNINDCRTNTDSDTSSTKEYETYYHKFQYYLNDGTNQSSSSCDNTSENSDFMDSRSKEDSCEANSKCMSNSSGNFSDAFPSDVLPYISFTSSSSSAAVENSIFYGIDIAEKISVGVQTEFETHYKYTSTTSKMLNKKHRSQKRKKSYSTGSQLTPKSKWKYRKYRNSPLKNKINSVYHKLAYNVTTSFSEKCTPEKKSLKSCTSIPFQDINNGTQHYQDKSLNKMETYRPTTSNIVSKDFMESESDSELINQIDKARTEIIGISVAPIVSNVSENGLIELLEKAESEVFGKNNIQEELENSKKDTKLSPQNSSVINEIKGTFEIKKQGILQTDMDFTNPEFKIKNECPVWKILIEIESPFKWAPDIMILKGSDKKLQDNFIEHLIKKEVEFSQAKKNIFRETVVHLVLAYEKILDDRLVEAMGDIRHCFNLLGYTHVQEAFIENSNIQEIEENSKEHEYNFHEIKHRRQNFISNMNDKVIPEPRFSNDVKLNQPIRTEAQSIYATDGSIRDKNSNGHTETLCHLTSGASGDNIKVVADASFCVGSRKFDDTARYRCETSNENKNIRNEYLIPEPESYADITTSFESQTLLNGMAENPDKKTVIHTKLLFDIKNGKSHTDTKLEHECPTEMRKVECENENISLMYIVSSAQNSFTEIKGGNEIPCALDSEKNTSDDKNKIDHISVCEDKGNKSEDFNNLVKEHLADTSERKICVIDQINNGIETGVASMKPNYFEENYDQCRSTAVHNVIMEKVGDFKIKRWNFSNKQNAICETMVDKEKIRDTGDKLKYAIQNPSSSPNIQQNINEQVDEVNITDADDTGTMCSIKETEVALELKSDSLSHTPKNDKESVHKSHCYENLAFELNENGCNEKLINSDQDKSSIINNCEEININSENNYLQLKKAEDRKRALECVVSSVLAHVAYFSGSYKESYQIAKRLEKKYNALEDAGKATLLAVKGSMILEYGYSGNKLGLEFMQKAQQMDPDHWEWNLLCGKIMGRIRRVEGSNGRKPTEEEVEYLQKSTELYREDASALVHLANVYRCLAHFIYKENLEAQKKNKPTPTIESRPFVRQGGRKGWSVSWHPPVEEELDALEKWRNPQQIPTPRPVIPLHSDQKDYLQLAKKLYLEALELEPNCPYNNARCAKGLWSMPNPYRDKDRAQEAIFQAVFLAPENSLVNHYAGLFYEFCHDYEKALECYGKAFCDSKCNFPAEMNFINLKLKTSFPRSYSPLYHLNTLLRKYSSPSQTLQTLCHKGFYLYKVEGLYFLAIQDIVEAIKINPESQFLKTFYAGNFYGQNPSSYNMYDLLEEIVAKYKSLPEATENEDFINKALETVRKLKPEVLDGE